LLTLINGNDSNQVSVFDRGLMYGQCVFETIAVSNGKPCLLEAHLERLVIGANLLSITVDQTLISKEVVQLAKPLARGIIRVNLTMGEGGRGYQNPTQAFSTRIISQHEYPNYSKEYWTDGIELGLATIRLSQQPALAGIKHGNRLEQVIARSEWKNHWQEALILDTDDNVIEGTQSNVFLVRDQCLITPKLNKAGVNGVMRQCIIDWAKAAGFSVLIKTVSLEDIEQADEVFMSNSVIGLWPVKRFIETAYCDLTLTNKVLKYIIKNEFIPNY